MGISWGNERSRSCVATSYRDMVSKSGGVAEPSECIVASTLVDAADY